MGDFPTTDIGASAPPAQAHSAIQIARWQRTKQIFGLALDAEPCKRQSVLHELCGGDESLLAEVSSLLAAADSEVATSEVFKSISSSPHRSEIVQEDSMLGRLVGDYKIERRIGYGGMAAVYLASRADSQYRKQVAIKLVTAGLDSQEIVQRFRIERQTLAALDHPNVVKLLDGGTTPEGVPFLVMDYVEGSTIHQYCDDHKLSTSDRLRLFRNVCTAVQYAHQNLIIHRDLKPTNILVTSDGTAKLLDFGIAKVLNPDISSLTLPFTQSGIRQLTPAYASPEQVRGDPITYATDIYSLGVVLYELLTGHRPYHLKRHTPMEIEREICETDPEKPSTAVSRVEIETAPDGTTKSTITPDLVSRTREGEPEQLKRRLRGDLDNIVLMALRKEPQRRYASVEEFSADIGRHLESRPVKARKGTLAYRASKFIRRHKREVLSASSMLLLVLGGIFAVLGLGIGLMPRQPKVVRSVPITNDGLPKLSLVTDGARLYFQERANTEFLARVSANGGETERMPLNLLYPQIYDISPNRSELLVSSSGPGLEREVELWIVPVPAGEAHRVGTILAHDACWAPDGRHIIYANGATIFSVGRDGNGAHKLVESALFPYWIRFSPDGNRLRFTDDNSLWEVAATGEGLHRMSGAGATVSDECCGSWSPDGKYYYFQASHDKVQNVWVLRERRSSFQSGTPEQLTTGPLSFGTPVPSVDGRRLFVLGEQRRAELVRYDGATKQFVPYLGGISAGQVDISRDGQWVTYVTYPEGALWRSKVDGSERIQLTAFQARLPRWSPDGKRIVFTGERSKLFVISAEGGTPREIMPEDQLSEIDATWSPDGNSIVFGRLLGTDITIRAVHQLDLKTGRLSKLPSSDGMYSPRVSPDGRYISAISVDSTRLMLYDSSATRWSELAKGNLHVGWNNWSRDGKYVYFLAEQGAGKLEEDRVRIPDGTLERVADLSGVWNGADPALQWIAPGPDNSPLIMHDKSTQEIYALHLQLP